MNITQEMIDECINDTSINGKYIKFYEMLENSFTDNISGKRLKSIKATLDYVGIDYENMSKFEILYKYSQLI